MQTLWQDLRYGARMLAKQPGFTVIAILTLALGIGVNTALFTGFNLILRPRPIKDPDSVVRIGYQRGSASRNFSYPDYVWFREHARSFSDLLPGFEEKFLLGETTAGVEPEEIAGTFVSDNHLAALGGGLRLGRFFTPEENQVAGRDAVVVLSHSFWQRRFAGNPGIVGQSLLLNGKPFTVIGVTGAEFIGLGMDAPAIWLPLMMRAAMATVHFEGVAAENRDWFGRPDFQWLSLHARLKPGKTLAEARAEMALLHGQLPRPTPAPAARDVIQVGPLTRIGPKFWTVWATVMGASGLVLLIACTNLANMLLARAAMRQKEIGLRLALGASRWRVIRQLLTESFLLAASGGAAGVLFAWWTAEMILPWASGMAGWSFDNRALSLSPDWRVLGFALSLSLLSNMAFGLVPALQATGTDLIAVIKDDSRSFGGGLTRSRLRSGLVVAQVALCLLLLIPAGLLLRALTSVLAADPGFEAKKLLVVFYSLELSGYDELRAQLFSRELQERLAALPGVQSVSPERGYGGRASLSLPGESGASGTRFDGVPFYRVTANYLETIGTPVLQGRNFTAEEAQANAPVVIVSESAARNLWPNKNPLGRTFRVERPLRDGSEIVFPDAEVIGVARDNQIFRVGQTPPLFFYAPTTMAGGMDTALLVRTARDAASMIEQARRTTFALEPVLRLDVYTKEEDIANNQQVIVTRAALWLAAALGGLALALAALGLYGVVAFSVAQRTREIGVRLALGAKGHDVMTLVLKQGLRLALLGVALGVAGSLAVTRLLRSLLFGLSAADPSAYGGVALLLIVVALVACWIPARRATKVDPMVALGHD
ncbi:MAG: ABC transporter permease [Acidobacteria bacterium]|nr:ABC transporter permease [Acidobacteriota bacterium]